MLTRIWSGKTVGVAVVLACGLAVFPASSVAGRTKHRPGCGAECRQAGGIGGGPPPAPPKMSVSPRTVHRDGRFVDLNLTCLNKTTACRGVILIFAPSFILARANLFVPAGQTWTIEMTPSRKGLAYLKSHRRVRAALQLQYDRGRGKNAHLIGLDSFRITILD